MAYVEAHLVPSIAHFTTFNLCTLHVCILFLLNRLIQHMTLTMCFSSLLIVKKNSDIVYKHIHRSSIIIVKDGMKGFLGTSLPYSCVHGVT